MENSKRIRPTAEQDNNIGQQRHERYACVIDRYNKAKEDGYPLEAITLMESLISDRLESLANYVAQKYAASDSDFSYKTLGCLTEFLGGKRQSRFLSKEMNTAIGEIDKWREERNKLLHEMAKLDSGSIVSVEELYKKAKTTAAEGISLFRKIDKEIMKTKKNNEK